MLSLDWTSFSLISGVGGPTYSRRTVIRKERSCTLLSYLFVLPIFYRSSGSYVLGAWFGRFCGQSMWRGKIPTPQGGHTCPGRRCTSTYATKTQHHAAQTQHDATAAEHHATPAKHQTAQSWIMPQHPSIRKCCVWCVVHSQLRRRVLSIISLQVWLSPVDWTSHFKCMVIKW
jgi:hypothetical protein